MAYRFGSDEWANALKQHINESSEYKNAAAKWGLDFNGNVVLAFEKDERLAQPLNLLLRLKGGACSGVEFVKSADHPDAGFVLSGPFQLWQEILRLRERHPEEVPTRTWAILSSLGRGRISSLKRP